MWFSTSSGRIEINMTLVQARSVVINPGECSSDVKALMTVPTIRRQLAKLSPSLVRDELAEYGAWEDDELQDHMTNLSRLVWLAGCDIAENYIDKQKGGF
jgi:hypothetical protein